MSGIKVMKCPNCRCVVPESSISCVYCGYRWPLGDETTVQVFRSKTDTYSSELLKNIYQYGDYHINAVDYSEFISYRPENSHVFCIDSDNSGFDFSIITSDGTLDTVKALIYFLGCSIIFMLIMLLLMLLLII